MLHVSTKFINLNRNDFCHLSEQKKAKFLQFMHKKSGGDNLRGPKLLPW